MGVKGAWFGPFAWVVGAVSIGGLGGPTSRRIAAAKLDWTGPEDAEAARTQIRRWCAIGRVLTDRQVQISTHLPTNLEIQRRVDRASRHAWGAAAARFADPMQHHVRAQKFPQSIGIRRPVARNQRHTDLVPVQRPNLWGARHLYSRLTNLPFSPKCLFCKEKSKRANCCRRQACGTTQGCPGLPSATRYGPSLTMKLHDSHEQSHPLHMSHVSRAVGSKDVWVNRSTFCLFRSTHVQEIQD